MYLYKSLVCVCGQKRWARNILVMWQLSIVTFKITFTLRQVQVSDTHKFPMHSSHWMVCFGCGDFFFFFAFWPCVLLESQGCAPLSCLTHSLAVEDVELLDVEISLFSALPPSPWTLSCSQKYSSLTLHEIISRFPFFPFSYPVLHLIPAILVWCGGSDFSTCAFILFVHTVVLFSLFPLN